MLVTPVSWSRTPCSTCNICTYAVSVRLIPWGATIVAWTENQDRLLKLNASRRASIQELGSPFQILPFSVLSHNRFCF